MASKRLAVMDAILRRFRAGFGGASELGVLEGDASGYLWHTQPHVTTATRIGDTFWTVYDSDTDDSTVSLSATDGRNILAKGSAINRWFDVPDATSLVAGTVGFVVANWSSEFVGVKNSDSTLWIRVAPSQTATVWLVTGGTAAGVWGATLSMMQPQYGHQEFDDFIMGVGAFSYSKLGLYSTTNGTGATTSITTPNAVGSNACGTAVITTGTDSNGRAALSEYNSTFSVGSGMVLTAGSRALRILDLATNDDDYILDFGFGDSATDAEHTDGVLFRYKRATSTKWLRVKADGGAVVETATTVDVAANTNLDMRIELAAGSSRADFWINRAHVGSETTGLPSGADYVGFVWKVVKTAGTTNRGIVLDALEIATAKNTRRS